MANNKRRFSVLVCMFLTVLVCSRLQASSGEREGIYFGLSFATSQISGPDFDAEHFVTNEDIFISIPKLDRSLAYGLVLGFQAKIYAVELSYLGSSHSGSLYDPRLGATGPLSTQVERSQFILDGLLILRIFKKFELLGILGGSASHLRLVNNFYLGEPVYYNAYDYYMKYAMNGGTTFRGLGLHLGAGLNIPISRAIGLTFRAIYRPLKFSSAKASNYHDQTYTFDDLSSSEFVFQVGLIYTKFVREN